MKLNKVLILKLNASVLFLKLNKRKEHKVQQIKSNWHLVINLCYCGESDDRYLHLNSLLFWKQMLISLK